MDTASDSLLLARLKSASDAHAAQLLWARYFERLAALARGQLSQRTRRVTDEEDIALNAFDSFFRGVTSGRFPKLEDRDDLWQVLVMLTERKAIDAIRRATSVKRGGGEVRGDSVLIDVNNSSVCLGMDQLASDDPDPALAALFADECQRLLKCLGDPELMQVALLRLEGYSTEEIATKVNRSIRSIQRKLETIRRIWEKTTSSTLEM